MNLIPSFIHRRIAHRPNLVKIVDNIGWLFIDKLLRMGVGLFVGVWVARYLGPDQFGLLNFALSFTGLFGAIATLGLQSIVIRDIVRDPEAARLTLGTAAVLQLIGGLLSYLLILGVIAYLRPDDVLARSIVAILGAMMLLKAGQIAVYWFESQVQSKYTVWVQNGVFLVFAAIKVGLILQQAPMIAFVWSMLAEAVVVALILLIVMGWRGAALGSLRVSFARGVILLRDSWPLILSAIAVSLAMRIDQVMIGELLNDISVGYYSVGVRLAEIFIFIGMIVSQSVFPRLVSLNEGQFEREYIYYLRIPFYFLFCLSILVSFFSKDIVTIVFGAEYIESHIALSILIFSIPITYVSVMSFKYLLRRGQQKEILFRQTAGLIVNIALNLVLIWRFGIAGAAMATLITDLVISFGMDLGRNKYRRLLRLKLMAIFNFRLIEA